MDGSRELPRVCYRPAPRRHRALGFTIVELVAVVVLLSILGVVALARLPSQDMFAPAIVTEAVLSEVRLAQQMAASRYDAVVSVSLSGEAAGWRIRVLSDVDGVIRSQLVESPAVVISAASGAASADLDPATSLSLTFDHRGYLATVILGSASGAPSRGVLLTVRGDSERQLCVYSSGYVNDAACG